MKRKATPAASTTPRKRRRLTEPARLDDREIVNSIKSDPKGSSSPDSIVTSRHFPKPQGETSPTRRSRYFDEHATESPTSPIKLRLKGVVTSVTILPRRTRRRTTVAGTELTKLADETVYEKRVLVPEVEDVSAHTTPSKPSGSPKSSKSGGGAVTKSRKKVTLQLVTLRTHHDRSTFMLMRLILVQPLLVQALLFHRPEWLLIATIFLNVTSGKAALPVMNKVRVRWPTMEALSKAHAPELETLLTPLGLGQTRTQRLIQFAKMWLEDPPDQANLRPSRVQAAKGEAKYPPTAVSHLPGMGRYALDSYRIFCGKLVGGNEWKKIMPLDKELRVYIRWRWAVDGSIWDCERGVLGPATEEYLNDLCEGRLDASCIYS